MLKILNGYNWLSDGNTDEIDECIDKGLLKYTDGEYRPHFIALEKNLVEIKEIIGEDYNRLEEKTFMEWIEFDFCGSYGDLEIENIFKDKIIISMNNIYDLILDDEGIYFSDEDKLRIYNAESPNDEIKFELDKIGREQARIQIKNLLDSITDQQFE